MAYYNVCPNCGCNLDPGEKCDCGRERQPEGGRDKEKDGERHGGYFAEAGRVLSWDGNRAVRVG